MNLHDSIVQSCDVYFYKLAVELGIDRMSAFIDGFGLGHPTGIDVLNEKSGILPSREWKRKAFARRADKVWFKGETVITGIGQGFMLATPLQLAHMAATLASRGQRYEPRLVVATRSSFDGEISDLDPISMPGVSVADEAHWDKVLVAMEDVVNGQRGTARAISHGAEYKIAGKTGTAQVFSIAQDEEYEEDKVAERLRHHALFIAYAPAEEPIIALAVIVENGGGGSTTAAPVARAVLDAYLAGEAQ